MQLLLLLAMLLANGEPNHAAAAAPPLPGVRVEAADPAPPAAAAKQLVSFVTEGDSMSPAIASGDRLDVDGSYYASHKPQRGDIIVFRAPDERNFVKRIVGLPGESIRFERSKLYVNGKLEEGMPLKGNPSTIEEIKLSDHQLYVLGDNYAHSYDSRYLGPIETASVVGKVVGIAHQPPARRQTAKPAHAPRPQPGAKRPQPGALQSRLSALRSPPASKPSPPGFAATRPSTSPLPSR
jgi:signal peptidase I